MFHFIISHRSAVIVAIYEIALPGLPISLAFKTQFLCIKLYKVAAIHHRVADSGSDIGFSGLTSKDCCSQGRWFAQFWSGLEYFAF